jgi:uncharacterized protein YcbK (DUF882 family)
MKMREKDWSEIRYFSPHEKWGEPLLMDRETVFLLDILRGLFKSPFVIHCGYERSGHMPDSQHYTGKAADFHVVGLPFRNAVDLMVDLVGSPPRGTGVCGKIGLGIYPHWTSPGFHLDTRGAFARWGAIICKGRQVYVSWDEAYEAIG